jgi:hypothetical protein
MIKLIEFKCSDNADDEIWHDKHAKKLLEPYNKWFKQRNFEYKKDYEFKFKYDTDYIDFTTMYKVFLETSNNELLTLFKLRWN